MAREKAELWDRPTYVYRYFADEVLLYVGIAERWEKRQEDHRKGSFWYPMATHLIVELYADRHRAFAVESWAITYEGPVGNTEAQWKWCPFMLPTPELSFGRRIRRYNWDGDEIPASPYVEARWPVAS